MSSKKNPDTERFGGPGSSHQDRTQPEAVDQVTGHKGGTPADDPPVPGQPINPDHSRVSGGGGEKDRGDRHTLKRS
jgi:hypothetical protein